MYDMREVTEDVDGERRLVGVDIFCGTSRAAGFRGGMSMMLSATVANCRTTEHAQQFMHGAVLAMTHCCITGSIPTVVDR